MKPQARRAAKGRRGTPPAPTVQELLGKPIDRRLAYLDGHQGALFDELNASLQEAHRLNNQRKPADLPVLPDGTTLDARLRSNTEATVTIPLWAFDVVCQLESNIARRKSSPRRSRTGNMRGSTAQPRRCSTTSC